VKTGVRKQGPLGRAGRHCRSQRIAARAPALWAAPGGMRALSSSSTAGCDNRRGREPVAAMHHPVGGQTDRSNQAPGPQGSQASKPSSGPVTSLPGSKLGALLPERSAAGIDQAEP